MGIVHCAEYAEGSCASELREVMTDIEAVADGEDDVDVAVSGGGDRDEGKGKGRGRGERGRGDGCASKYLVSGGGKY